MVKVKVKREPARKPAARAKSATTKRNGVKKPAKTKLKTTKVKVTKAKPKTMPKVKTAKVKKEPKTKAKAPKKPKATTTKKPTVTKKAVVAKKSKVAKPRVAHPRGVAKLGQITKPVRAKASKATKAASVRIKPNIPSSTHHTVTIITQASPKPKPNIDPNFGLVQTFTNLVMCDQADTLERFMETAFDKIPDQHLWDMYEWAWGEGLYGVLRVLSSYIVQAKRIEIGKKLGLA